METQEVLADFWVNQVQLVQRATSNAERDVALHRANIAHAAFFLMRELGHRPGESAVAQMKRFDIASRAATATLRVLGVKDGFGLSDRRGNSDGKCLLWDVAEQALALYLPHRTAAKRRDGAPGFAASTLSDAQAAELIARDIHMYGLADPSCIAIFGIVPDSALAPMRDAIMKFLENNRDVRAQELCGQALVGAGLLTPKARSAFFEVDRGRWKRERGYE